MKPQTLDNTKRLERSLKRFPHYWKVFSRAQKKINPFNLLKIQFPFLFPRDPLLPPAIYLEFSNVCPCKCQYCSYPDYKFPEKFINPKTFDNILKSIQNYKNRFKIVVGGGEATLSPHFTEFSRKLAGYSGFLSVVTSGQMNDERILNVLSDGTYDFVEFSVDAGSPEEYMNSRKGASFEKLKKNLVYVKNKKKELNSRTLLGLRLMIRPSKKNEEEKYMKLWEPYCDTLILQYLMKPMNSNYGEDIFISIHESENIYPKCTDPFRLMQIKANGDVPLCAISGNAKEDKKIIVGNINQSSINELWNDQIFKTYRKAHRKRIPELMPVCKGCCGG